MNLTINGDDKVFAQDTLSVAGLLRAENVSQPDQVSVQLNDEFLRAPQYESTFLKDGDAVNFLYFMGGGQ
jgi:sulfur carrier protein